MTGQTDYTDSSDPPGPACLQVQLILLRSSMHRLWLASRVHTAVLLSHAVPLSTVSFELLWHPLCGDLLSTAHMHSPEVQTSDTLEDL